MDRQKKIVKTSNIGIVVNILLVIFKAIVGFLANSIAIILDAINNLTDCLSSIITIIGIKLSGKAPDKEHPYGHGRIEYFSSLIIGVLVLLAGLASLKESIAKIIDPAQTNYTIITLIVVGASIITKFFLGTYVRKVGKEINSDSLVASGTDALMDSVISISTFVAAVVAMTLGIGVEGYLGAIISVVIIKSALEILKDTIDTIIGERADPELTRKLKARVCKFKEVQGAYDLILHNYGPNNIIGSVHIQVRNDMTAEEIHILAREITYKIYEEFGITLTIGIYAANDKGKFGEIKKYINQIIRSYKEVLQIHGFYVDNAKETIYFDLIIDFSCNNREQVRDEIVEKLKKKYPKYKFNVIIDSDMSD